MKNSSPPSFPTPTQCLLRDHVFLTMVLAASEVYKKETLGFLLGYQAGDLLLVEYAVPLQSAERGFVWAKVPEARLKRIEELSERFSLGLHLIGDFHSHTQLGSSLARAEPSPTDIAFMDPGRLYIILAVNEYQGKKHQVWHRKGKKLAGSLGEYAFEIGAFYCDRERHYVELEIRCPFAQAL